MNKVTANLLEQLEAMRDEAGPLLRTILQKAISTIKEQDEDLAALRQQGSDHA